MAIASRHGSYADRYGWLHSRLPTQLIEAFQSTLEESRTMDLLLHVVDASAPDRLQHERTVQTLMKRISVGKYSVLDGL